MWDWTVQDKTEKDKMVQDNTEQCRKGQSRTEQCKMGWERPVKDRTWWDGIGQGKTGLGQTGQPMIEHCNSRIKQVSAGQVRRGHNGEE